MIAKQKGYARVYVVIADYFDGHSFETDELTSKAQVKRMIDGFWKDSNVEKIHVNSRVVKKA